MTRRFALLACVLTIGLTGAGCQAVPTDSPVGHLRLDRGHQARGSDPAVVDVRPHPGQNPVQIVQGFLEAMATYEPQFPMARKFLTPEAAAKWRPEQGILVYDEPVVVPSGKPEGRVTLTGEKIGEVGSDGGWQPAEADSDARVEFDMEKVDGDWRINGVPDAILTTESYFDREYYPYNIYFFDPEFQVLAPDPMYLPQRGNIETMLVRALLRGPTDWLGSAVSTAVPTGTRMLSPSVTIRGQAARVDLSEQVLQLSKTQRRQLIAQLIWTLREAIRVDEVKITVDQVPLDIPTSGWEKYAPAVANAPTSPYAVAEREVRMVRGGKLEPAVANLPFVPKDLAVALAPRSGVPTDPERPDLRRPLDKLAVVADDGRSVLVYARGQSDPHQVGDGDFGFHNVRSASWDRSGRLWLVDSKKRKARIVVNDETGVPREIQAPGLTGRDVRSLKVSRDGTRVAALVQSDTASPSTELVVGLVDYGGRTTVRDVREIPIDFTTATDLAWSDVDQMLVVGRGGHEPNGLAWVSIDGSSFEPVNDAPPLAPEAIAAAPNQPLLVVTGKRELARRDPMYGWAPMGKATLPAYPG